MWRHFPLKQLLHLTWVQEVISLWHPSLLYYEYQIGSRWLEFLLLAWICQLSGFSLTTSSSWYNTIIRIILVYKWSIWRIPRRHGLANETTKINQIITPWGHLAYYTHSPLWWLGYFTWTADLKETKKSVRRNGKEKNHQNCFLWKRSKLMWRRSGVLMA